VGNLGLQGEKTSGGLRATTDRYGPVAAVHAVTQLRKTLEKRNKTNGQEGEDGQLEKM